jgi:hypothetical protein
MRTYYRAAGGIDGAIQTLLFWAVILTAPIWIPAGLIFVAYTLWVDAHPSPKPVPAPQAVVQYERPVCRAYLKLKRTGAPANVALADRKLRELGCPE